MEKLDYKLDFSCQAEQSGGIPVIVLAAGSSQRMKGISKQFLNLCGVPAIIHTLSVFEKSPKISRIVLVTKDEYVSDMQQLSEKFMITKLSDIVSGGATRQESVKNGLDRINEDFVLIHDGARPLVTEEIISRVCELLPFSDAVICAVPVKDTVKKVDSNGIIESTLPREALFSAQTPQGVSVEKYSEALKNIDCSVFTDDASIMESAGYKVKVVMGDYTNIKITTQDDISVAESFIEKRGIE